jgi:hypothetical protein
MSGRKESSDKKKTPESLIGVTLIGKWEKANLIGLVNGSPSPTAIGAHNVKLYKGGVIEYQLPVRDGDAFTTLYTDLRCWLLQPVE